MQPWWKPRRLWEHRGGTRKSRSSQRQSGRASWRKVNHIHFSFYSKQKSSPWNTLAPALGSLLLLFSFPGTSPDTHLFNSLTSFKFCWNLIFSMRPILSANSYTQEVLISWLCSTFSLFLRTYHTYHLPTYSMISLLICLWFLPASPSRT